MAADYVTADYPCHRHDRERRTCLIMLQAQAHAIERESMAPIKRNWMMCWIGSVRGLLFLCVYLRKLRQES